LLEFLYKDLGIILEMKIKISLSMLLYLPKLIL
jgi:hypothetical protein